MDGFHSHDGWFWKRLEDGSVRVRITGYPDGRFTEHILDPGSWASVVASVSPDGDNADTFRDAQRLHLNGSVKNMSFDPRTALGPEHMETLGKMADDVRKARDAHLNDPLA